MALSKFNELPVSLDSLVRTVGINPAHFNQSYGTSDDQSTTAYGFCSSCSDLWCQETYQAAENRLSREALSEQVVLISQMLSAMLSGPVVPTQTTKYFSVGTFSLANQRLTPRIPVPCVCSDSMIFRRKYMIGNHIMGYKHTKWTSIGTANLSFSDPNDDGIDEIAKVTFSVPESVTNDQIAAFHSTHFGDKKWQLRDFEISRVDGTNDDTVTISFPSYLLIKPAILFDGGVFTRDIVNNCSCLAIDFSKKSNLVTSVDVGYIEWDYSKPVVQFIMKSDCGECGGIGCTSCSTTTQDGCYLDYGRYISPVAATWDGTKWEESYISYDRVIGIKATVWKCFNYGDAEYPYASYPIDERVKRIIAYSALGRMSFGPCECACNQGSNWTKLWTEMDVVVGQGRIVDYSKIANPFGTSLGGFLAYDIFRTIDSGIVFGSEVS